MQYLCKLKPGYIIFWILLVLPYNLSKTFNTKLFKNIKNNLLLYLIQTSDDFKLGILSIKDKKCISLFFFFGTLHSSNVRLYVSNWLKYT